jgi:anionic cell wall polymer biosynthesis LytR-Cps2A-Psr (LCP) family protein
MLSMTRRVVSCCLQGTSIVDGEQALAFVRARKTLGDGSDLQRIQRQQAFLSSMIREATDTGLLLNPLRLYEVLDAGTSLPHH